MARKQGSDELYRLIHVLTVEEKGYFKKYAKRYAADGNKYLQLFDAINKQEKFEETSLKRKFKSYPVQKIYLKEMITDSLVLYHRNNHSHLQLLNRVEKVHVLLEKGLFAEAAKEAEKALEISRRMEVFTIERYLLRIQRKLRVSSLSVIFKEYKGAVDKNLEYEADLTNWELKVLDWFARTVNNMQYAGTVTKAEIQDMAAVPVKTTNSSLDQQLVLMYMYMLNGDYEKCYQLSKEQIQQVKEFKQKVDPNATTAYTLNNHVRNCLALGYFDEGLLMIDEMLNSFSGNSFQANNGRLRAYMAKIFAYMGCGKFEEALQFMYTIEKEMLALSHKQNDSSRVQMYKLLKTKVLLYTKRHRECWLLLQELRLKPSSPAQTEDYIGWTESCLMVQLEMKNYSIVNTLARKQEKVFARLGVKNELCQLMFSFFKQVNELNFKVLAKEYYKKVSQLASGRNSEEAYNFSYWLDEISGGKTVTQHLGEKVKDSPQ